MDRTATRRKFLASTLLASGSLLLMPRIGTKEARAGTPKAPLRLILLLSPFQMPEAFYHPQVSSTNSAMAPAGTSFFLDYPNSILGPLAPFQSDLIIFRGLKYGMAPNSHDSVVTAFTGFPINTSSGTPAQSGSSIEQYLFGRMAQKGSLSPFLAGAFSYLFADHCYDSDISFKNGNPVAQIGNPLKLYNSLFANFTPPGNQPPPPDVVRQTNRRQQTVGLVQKYLKGMSGELPATSPSYAILQSHLAAAQGLASQLGAGGMGSFPSCAPPAAGSLTNDTGPDDGSLVAGNAVGDFASFTKIMTQALACDITRFGAFKMADSGDPAQILLNQMPGLTGWNQSNNFHAIVSHGASGAASDALTLQMAQYKRYFMTQAANLLTALKAVADPYSPTQSIYDNTVVLIGSEGPVEAIGGSDVHGNGDPNSDQPFIVAGGCGGYFKQGQLLFAGGAKTASVNHNALLTNIVNAFEKNQQEYSPSFTPNPLTQYGSYGFSVSPTSWLT